MDVSLSPFLSHKSIKTFFFKVCENKDRTLKITTYSGPPYPQRIHSKTTSVCLKPWIVLNTIYTMFLLYIHSCWELPCLVSEAVIPHG